MVSDLQEALRELGLDWVVEQVNALLAVGRVTVVQVPTITARPGLQNQQLEITTIEQGARRGGPKADFAQAVAYSPSEQLSILLDAIDQTCIQTAKMQLQMESTANDLLDTSEIELTGPTTATDLSLVQGEVRVTSTSSLVDLLRDLRNELASGR